MEGQKEFISKKKEHQLALEDHNNCCLCGSRLVFKHKIDYLTLNVNEQAFCKTCQIPLKNREFRLQ